MSCLPIISEEELFNNEKLYQMFLQQDLEHNLSQYIPCQLRSNKTDVTINDLQFYHRQNMLNMSQLPIIVMITNILKSIFPSAIKFYYGNQNNKELIRCKTHRGNSKPLPSLIIYTNYNFFVNIIHTKGSYEDPSCTKIFNIRLNFFEQTQYSDLCTQPHKFIEYTNDNDRIPYICNNYTRIPYHGNVIQYYVKNSKDDEYVKERNSGLSNAETELTIKELFTNELNDKAVRFIHPALYIDYLSGCHYDMMIMIFTEANTKNIPENNREEFNNRSRLMQ